MGAKPGKDLQCVRVNPNGAVPAELLLIEDVMQQIVWEIKSGPPPGGAVNAGVLHLILAWALDVIFERQQDIPHDRFHGRRFCAQCCLDARAKATKHLEQVLGRVSERHERPAVVEENGVDAGARLPGVQHGHPHILSECRNGSASRTLMSAAQRAWSTLPTSHQPCARPLLNASCACRPTLCAQSAKAPPRVTRCRSRGWRGSWPPSARLS